MREKTETLSESENQRESESRRERQRVVTRCRDVEEDRAGEEFNRDIVRCGGSDVDRVECGAFLGLQPGVSLQAKPSRASGSPVPIQQGLAQSSIV